MLLAQSSKSRMRCFPSGCAALLIAAAIVSFSSAQGQDLQIDGAEVTRGPNGAFDAIDARITEGGSSLHAGRLKYDPATGRVSAREGVRIEHPSGAALAADTVDYLIEAREAQARGQIVLTDSGGSELRAAALDYSFIERIGAATSGATLALAGQSARLTAGAVFISPDGYDLTDATYTSCKTDDPDWLLSAGRIALAPDSTAEAEDVKLAVFGVPVMYLPRLTYSIDRQRKSGFLPPRVRFVDGGHSEVGIPYYVNIAPNADAEVGTRLISSRGSLLHADGRLLLRKSYSEAGVAVISDTELDERRYGWQLTHDAGFSRRWSLAVETAGVSDDEYAADFGSSDDAAQRHFHRSAELAYRADQWSARLATDGYQTVKEEPGQVEKPYARLPAVEVAYANRSADGVGLRAAAAVARFRREDDDLSGSRFNVRAEAGRSWQAGPAEIELTGGASGAAYSADGTANWLVPHAAAGVSFEFARPVALGGARLRQTLVPRLLLGAVPRHDYKNVPVYDTARAAFNVEHLYRANTFVGGDRFGDAPFATFGFETGLWDDAANRSVLSFRFAQRLLLNDSRAAASSKEPPAEGLSNALADLRFAPTENLMMVSQLEWSPEGRWEQVNLEGKAVYPDAAYALQYALSRDEEDLSESLIGAGILRTIGPRLQAAADATYSLDQSRITEVAGGLRIRADCSCWFVDVVLRRELVGADETDTEVLLLVSFQGLSDLGSRSYGELIDDLREPL